MVYQLVSAVIRFFVRIVYEYVLKRHLSAAEYS